jgi:hypothetical protein
MICGAAKHSQRAAAIGCTTAPDPILAVIAEHRAAVEAHTRDIQE